MDSDLFQLLRAHPIFSSLDDSVLELLLPKVSKVELSHGKALFHQGAPSDNIFILVSGKLSATMVDDTNQIKTIGHIEAGETVGELGALSHEPRSLTVKALRDSVLLKLNSKDFVELCYHYPAILFATVHPIVERTQNMIHSFSSKKMNKPIAIISAFPTNLYEKFIEKLSSHAKKYPSLIIVSDFDSRFSDDAVGHAVIKHTLEEIEHAKKRSQKIIYFLKSLETPLAKACIKKIDLLYLVVDAQEEKPIDPIILDMIHSRESHFTTNPILVVLHPADAAMPQNTKYWLQQTTFSMHHHIKHDSVKHHQRLLRFIRGKAVGLVLGGGGTRGFAHLGVLKALREHKVPVDMIGGSSVGALIAGCYAIQESFTDAKERFHAIVESSKGSVSWKNLTWPYVSLFNAKAFTESLQQGFADINIEDLWLPYFCISSNMATSSEAIHQDGLLWEKIRCSSSIPGLIPPMVIDGELHMDGGLLNNLPVDIMRQFLGKKGRITAVELNPSVHDTHRYHFPPILTLKQALLNKFGMVSEKYKFPRFIDNFLNGFLIGSSTKTKQNGSLANFLIALNLSKFRLLHSNLKQAEKMLETGYLETIEQINKEKNKRILKP